MTLPDDATAAQLRGLLALGRELIVQARRTSTSQSFVLAQATPEIELDELQVLPFEAFEEFYSARFDLFEGEVNGFRVFLDGAGNLFAAVVS